MRAAFYECDVTPPLGGFQWGHYREIYGNEVIERLYAKAVVVEDGGETAAIVVIDSCVVPPEMHGIVTKRIYEYTGITADKICIASNHAHTGAPISDSPEIGCLADEAYKDVFYRLCADAVILAYNRLDDSEVKFVSGTAPDIGFTRDYVLRDGRYVTHGAKYSDEIVAPLGDADDSLPVVMFERGGKPLGAIISFACHQCTVHGTTKGYSGDYSSVLSLRLKEKYGEDFVSLFLIGTSGNVNTANPNNDFNGLEHVLLGEKLAKTVIEIAPTAKTVTAGGVASCKEFIDVPRRSADPEEARDTMVNILETSPNLMRARNMLYYISIEEPTSTSLAVQCIRIGDILIACLPGEMYNAFGKRIKKESPFERTIVVENCNTYCGYIPTKEAFEKPHDKLYETSLCYHSCHVPEAGDMITDKTLEIANKLK